MEEVRRLVTVELFTDTFRYIGEIVIIGTGHNKRLTDYLNSAQPFIPLLNPKLYTINGELVREEGIVILNKTAIKFVFPLGESQEKFEEYNKKYIDAEKYFREFGIQAQSSTVTHQSPMTSTPSSSVPRRGSDTTRKLDTSAKSDFMTSGIPPKKLSDSNPYLKREG